MLVTHRPERRLDPVRCLLWASLICVLVAGGPTPATAQAPSDSLRTAVTLFGAAGSSGNIPFWLSANQYGTVDPTSANAGFRLSAYRPFAGTDGLDFAAGIELLGRTSDDGTVTAHELYGKLRYWKLQVTAGRKEYSIGRVDTSLSLGSTTHSRNAAPVPRVSISSVGYVTVPWTGRGLAFKGYLGHGWLEEDRFVRNALLHEKYLYGRLLPPDFPVNVYAGLTHHAMWGGTHPQEGPQQVSFARWTDVLVGDEVLVEGLRRDPPTFNPNHIAMYDFSVSADLGGVEGLVYRQFYHEDIASFNFRNVWDGLWGVSLRRDDPSALVNAVLWEHLRTTRQSTIESDNASRGVDSYYNHVHYRGGWTYQGRTIGNPLLTAAVTTPGLGTDLPSVGNNIVVAHHVGVEGHLGGGHSYQLLGTYSRNYGVENKVCETPSCESTTSRRTGRLDQWSVKAEFRGRLLNRHGLFYNIALAVDTGEFYSERVGGSFALTWRRPLEP